MNKKLQKNINETPVYESVGVNMRNKHINMSVALRGLYVPYKFYMF